MMAHRFAAPPAGRDPEHLLDDVIGLARDETFRAHRGAFYAWQEEVLGGRRALTPKEAVGEMAALLEKYSDAIAGAYGKRNWRFAFVLAGATLGTVGTLITGNPLSAVGGVLTLAQFATLDRKVVVPPNPGDPAAMFHDVQDLWK